jgi:hypothetical protein
MAAAFLQTLKSLRYWKSRLDYCLYNFRIGREYAIREHKAGNKINMGAYYEYWSPKIEKELRNTYIAIYRIKYPKTAVRFCDCAVEVIKKIYPDSIFNSIS